MQKKNDLQGKERINLIKAIAIDISIALSVFIVSTGICYLLQYFKVDVLNYIIIYILGILLTAVFTKGYIFSALIGRKRFWLQFLFYGAEIHLSF